MKKRFRENVLSKKVEYRKRYYEIINTGHYDYKKLF